MKHSIVPVSAPRMTQSDRWKKRPCVVRYFNFRKEVTDAEIKIKEAGTSVTFGIPMPPSWSKKKKASHVGKGHQSKPDIDNLTKALLDSIFKDDSHIWNITATKLWSYEGYIEIKDTKELGVI